MSSNTYYLGHLSVKSISPKFHHTGCLIVNAFVRMALRGRKIENFYDISLAAWSQELPCVFHNPVFKKVASAGLNSL